MSHPHFRFTPKYTEKKINHPDRDPMTDVVQAMPPSKTPLEYAPRVGGSMYLELATGSLPPDNAKIVDYATLEGRIEVPLLPIITEMPTIKNRLPPYEVKSRSREVVTPLFNPASGIYLPGLLLSNPLLNMVLLTHGKIWTPEIENVIMDLLKGAGFEHDDIIHHLFGEITETNAIVLSR